MRFLLHVNFWFLTAYKSYVYTIDGNNQDAIYNRGREEVYWRQTGDFNMGNTNSRST